MSYLLETATNSLLFSIDIVRNTILSISRLDILQYILNVYSLTCVSPVAVEATTVMIEETTTTTIPPVATTTTPEPTTSRTATYTTVLCRQPVCHGYRRLYGHIAYLSYMVWDVKGHASIDNLAHCAAAKCKQL